MNIKTGDKVRVKVIQSSEDFEFEGPGKVKSVLDRGPTTTKEVRIEVDLGDSKGKTMMLFFKAPGSADDIFYYEEAGYREQSRITKI